jgi:hypothetical protein
MSGYPWSSLDDLLAADLNAAFVTAYSTATLAQTLASNANSYAASALTVAQTAAARLTPMSVTLNWPAGMVVAAGTYVLVGTAPYGFTVTSADASVGSAGGTLIVAFRNAGLYMGSLGSFVVSAATKTNFPAIGNNLTVAAGALVDVVVTITGQPANAYLVLNGAKVVT